MSSLTRYLAILVWGFYCVRASDDLIDFRKSQIKISKLEVDEMSSPSTRILPSVGSTNLKNDSAKVLLADPDTDLNIVD
jgi:hypothetical protein